MSKLTLNGILAILKLVLQLLSKIVHLIDFIRDLMDDGIVDDSVPRLAETLDRITASLSNATGSAEFIVSDISHELGEL